MAQKLEVCWTEASRAIDGLKLAYKHGNRRLLQKHHDKLEVIASGIAEHVVAVKSGAKPDSDVFKRCVTIENDINSALLESELQLVRYEDDDQKSASKAVVDALYKELDVKAKLCVQMCDTPPAELILDVDEHAKYAFIKQAIKERQRSFDEVKLGRKELASQFNVEGAQDCYDKFTPEYNNLATVLDSWLCLANAIVIERDTPRPKPSEPNLKLDRLALPVFHGDVRLYARFRRDFQATVVKAHADEDVQLLYLKNQCLTGLAKDSVTNIVKLDLAWKRLDERFGQSSVVIGQIVKDLESLKLGPDSEKAVIKLHESLERAWDDVCAIERLEDFCNVIVLRTIESKLPGALQHKWLELKVSIMDRSLVDQVERLKSFLDVERRVAESVIELRGKAMTKIDRPKRFTGHLSGNSEPESKQKICYRCGNVGHGRPECRVPETIRCNACNKIGHMMKACRSKRGNTDGKEAKETETDTRRVRFQEKHEVKDCKTCVVSEGIRLPVDVVETSVGSCTVLYDTGSMLNIVRSAWARKHKLVGRRYSLQYRVVDGSIKKLDTTLYYIDVLGRDGLARKVKAYAMEEVMSNLIVPDINELKQLVSSWSYKVNVDDISFPKGQVDLLLGSEVLNIFPQTVYVDGDLCLLKSLLGLKSYVMAGSHSMFAGEVSMNEVAHVQVVDVLMNEDVCQHVVGFSERKQRKELQLDFWSTEAMGTLSPRLCRSCKECKVCSHDAAILNHREAEELQMIKSNLVYVEKDRVWKTSYPFLEGPETLRDNYQEAYRALQGREARLLKQPEIAKQYQGQIQDFVDRKVIQKLSDEEVKEWSGPVRYVDHHEVFKEGATTPLRLVINSSFKHGAEKSLNDILVKGPSLLPEILSLLLKWRFHPVGFIGDIMKMYHSVATEHLEGHVRRLLWRDFDQSKPPDVFVFKRVTFGDKPAGCICITALKETAKMHEQIDARASEILLNETYMDDVVAGANTLDEANHVISKLTEIASLGGFKFKDFTVSGQNNANRQRDLVRNTSLGSVLGVKWIPVNDKIVFKVRLNPGRKIKGKRKNVSLQEIRFTKRICLRLCNQVFDPLGILSPSTISIKLAMKNSFVGSDHKWDTVLSDDEQCFWRRTFEGLNELQDFTIDRSVMSNDVDDAVLIVFCDASKQAMSAAIYVRTVNAANEVHVNLLTAKARVSPIKSESIPRLELCAALMGARLYQKVVNAASVKFNAVHFFTDSRVALGMIKNTSSVLKEFVGIRAAEIRSLTNIADWAWIPSQENVADIGSRGMDPRDLKNSDLWKHGPHWLLKHNSEWPTSDNVDSKDEISCPEYVLATVIEPPVINVAKFDDLKRLLKVTAYALKFASSRGSGRRPQLITDWRQVLLTAEDYEAAELYWLKQVSASSVKLYDEGKLTSLMPRVVWDAEGRYEKVVTSGRLKGLMKVGYDESELMILDPKHPYTRLVLKDIHEQDHAGDNRVVWKSRCRFWIPNARRIVSHIRGKCYVCRLLGKYRANQIMAPLPPERVLPVPVWSHIAIDLFGPFTYVDSIKKRMTSKCWGVVITCLVSRAVHLDLTESYDTDSVLQVLRKFMCVRGTTPLSILSDQGSQLKAAGREMVGLFELINWRAIRGWAGEHRIKWKFAPVQGQHFNGCAEALIKSAKRVLEEKVRGKRYNFVELQTIFYEVAHILNCRPLGIHSTPSSDPLDGGPITPNHLLFGRASARIPDVKYDENPSLTKRIRAIKESVSEFWTKFFAVAFPSMVPQYRWHKKFRAAKLGDVVLMFDDSLKVAEYKLAVIEGLKLNADGLPRSVTLRYTKKIENGQRIYGYTTRPVNKISTIVPVEEQNES